MSKILIIDDERAIRRTLKEILQYEKFDVAEAEDGEQGIDMIKKYDYDVVICDIKMPKKDGIEVLDAVKEMGKHVPLSFYRDMEI
jgi:two-component system nitrogen regulation response regulator NtrX